MADMRSLCRRASESNRLIERDACFVPAAELQQECAFGAEKMEVTGQPLGQRFDHRQRCLRAADFADGNARFSVTTGEGCNRSSAA